ncbi:ATP-binding protein [Flavobacterium sp. 7A]|uniref:ATP-binding protein n=1 Tax=Flavobacterium sp. 7A TaxID=2940571 RepID=UPI002227D32E|nr:transporter substrate-binding domain-containing protein [Flavobacterium sp. 7A]MCW2120006.1 signal transduction histidine kinase/ABC-type amino acid transport substrate-binding protein/ActR/RegA family two-component response regulator [Flavobacterium sp. 7A]
MKNLKYFYYPVLLFLILFGVSDMLFSQSSNSPKKKVVKIGVYDNPPKIFLNDQGKPDGVFIDVIKEIGKNENIEFEYHFDTWDHLYKKLQTGQIDILPDMVFSAERDSIFTLSKLPVMTSWSELFSRRELDLHSILDLENLRVGVLKGSIEEKYMIEFVPKEFDVKYKLHTYDSYTGSVNALKKKEIDVVVADRFFAFSNLFINSIKPTGVVVRPLGLHFGFTKNKNLELVALFDKNISSLKNDADSGYYKSLFHWLEKDPKTVVPNYLKWIIWGTLSVLVIALAFVLLLRKSIKIKTKQLLNAKETAEESENQLQLIAGNLVNGMIYQIVTIDEDNRKFNYVSDTVVDLYGCTAAEVMEDPSLIYRKIYPDDIPIMRAAELKAIQTMSNYVVEIRVFNPDGSIRWSYSIAKPRIINGLVCWDGIEFDISERKQLEIDLKIAKEKAEESDRLKSAFLANMSHEIRTPMNGILGFAELLKKPDLKEKKQQKYIRIIEKSGVRMLNIINDIINISKIESGQMEIYTQESNINEQLEYINNFFTLEAEKKEIQLSCKKELPNENALMTTDREKVFAILTNLVKNAINHTQSGTVEFGYVRKNDFLEFYVKDSGIGVPLNRQSAIFERFIQADIANKMAQQGAGLGLSISKAYVEMLGGELWLESEEGRGSVFYFTLPFQNIKGSSKIINIAVKNPLSLICNPKLKILIAEDDSISRMLILKVIKEFSRDIIIAKNGLEAVTACQDNHDIDLILMDAQMPKMDGYEAMEEIRKFNKEIMIIVQSAYALSGDKEKAIAAGANEYITKPIKSEKLKQLVFRYFKDKE